MQLRFNHLLTSSGIAPRDVRLLRHQDKRSEKGKTPYELWRDDRPQFELYQSVQSFDNESALNAEYWAAFVGTPRGETLFAGLYSVRLTGPLKHAKPMPNTSAVDEAGSCNEYQLSIVSDFQEFEGKLFIDWGPGKRRWIQRADNQDKVITELHSAFKEPEFPGFLRLITQLSKINSFPASWISALTNSRGIYLLACPKTREHYVGRADGNQGFWGRWQEYLRTNHGGNVALKSRDPGDYQVTILEVAGTHTSPEELASMEALWKQKLLSREMGLNRN